MKLIRSAALAVMLGMTQSVHAQDTQWTTELDLPLGLNVPDGISFDVLGIAPGMTYDVVKAKLEEIAAGRAQVQETITTFSLAGGEFGQVLIEFPSSMELQYEPEPNVRERIVTYFTAPSSGHQLVLLSRRITYSVPEREPRIAEVLASMSAKFGGEPIQKPFSDTEWQWRYDDGRLLDTAQEAGDCRGLLDRYESPENSALINNTGNCDVLLWLRYNPGISTDHADSITMSFTDYERGRQNQITDYDFFATYLDRIRDNTAGEAPKL